jgi:hypothetical protein
MKQANKKILGFAGKIWLAGRMLCMPELKQTFTVKMKKKYMLDKTC